MNYLLLLVSLIFSLIFHFFYALSQGKDFFLVKDSGYSYSFLSFSGNLWLESVVFIVIGVLLFFYFSDFRPTKNARKKLSFVGLNVSLKSFFKKYLYYIGFIFFYSSIYIIFGEYDISVSYFIFFVNCLILGLFFISQTIFIFRDFIKVNTILFSIVYILFYVQNFTLSSINFLVIDFVNSFFILLFFVLSIYLEKSRIKGHKLDVSLTIYLFIYLFLFVSFYIFIFFQNLSIIFSLVGFVFSLVLFYIMPRFPLFKGNTIYLRILAILCNYFAIVFSIYNVFAYDFNLLVMTIIGVSSLFNLRIHTKYQNYISYGIGICAYIFFLFQTFFEYSFGVRSPSINIVYFSFSLAFIQILFLFFMKGKSIYDFYILNIYSYLIIAFGSIFYFIKNGFDILSFGIILFVGSIAVFLSYYKINSLKNKEAG